MPDGNKDSAPVPSGRLRSIKIDEITRNERNPRQTFNSARIEQLAASLQEIGLQVPITVYENPRSTRFPYVLLDGERRFRAAKLNNWETIQALVVPAPSAKENAVRMFNIHMLREDWEEIETAWALEQIIDETGIDNDQELQKITGLSIDRIRNMRRVLAFPKSVQSKVAEGDLKYQLLVELDKNVLSKSKEKKGEAGKPIVDMGGAQLRDIFLKKYQDNVESDIVELRKVGALFDTARSGGRPAERAAQALTRLVTKPDATIEEAYETGAASSVELSRVLRDMKSLPRRIKDLLDSKLQQDQRDRVGDAIKSLESRLADLLKKV
jgi:ParB family chromosome partitioning protein